MKEPAFLHVKWSSNAPHAIRAATGRDGPSSRTNVPPDLKHGPKDAAHHVATASISLVAATRLVMVLPTRRRQARARSRRSDRTPRT